MDLSAGRRTYEDVGQILSNEKIWNNELALAKTRYAEMASFNEEQIAKKESPEPPAGPPSTNPAPSPDRQPPTSQGPGSSPVSGAAASAKGPGQIAFSSFEMNPEFRYGADSLAALYGKYEAVEKQAAAADAGIPLTRRGTAAAVAFAFTPFVFAHTAHIQLLMTFGLPLSALAMHRLVDAPSLGRSVALGLALALQGFACAYYGIFAGLLVGAGVLFYAWARGLWRSPRYWLAAAGSAAISVALLLPLLVLYLDLQAEGGVQRSLGNAATYASSWRDYLTSAAWAHRWMLPWLRPWVEVLFPGLVTVTLAGAGLWLGLRRGRAEGTDPGAATAARVRREHTIFYGLLAGLAFWASLGPKAGLYSALYHALPVFSFLRAPARFGVIVVLALAVLAAFAVERWLARMPRTRAAWAGAVPG